jgi:hypothetical protein
MFLTLPLFWLGTMYPGLQTATSMAPPNFLHKHREQGVWGVLADRKIYHLDKLFVKRTLRKLEWIEHPDNWVLRPSGAMPQRYPIDVACQKHLYLVEEFVPGARMDEPCFLFSLIRVAGWLVQIHSCSVAAVGRRRCANMIGRDVLGCAALSRGSGRLGCISVWWSVAGCFVEGWRKAGLRRRELLNPSRCPHTRQQAASALQDSGESEGSDLQTAVWRTPAQRAGRLHGVPGGSPLHVWRAWRRVAESQRHGTMGSASKPFFGALSDVKCPGSWVRVGGRAAPFRA